MWEKLASVELQLLSTLHHPLMVNLAYAFQTIEYLILVMDLCGSGDLLGPPPSPISGLPALPMTAAIWR